ncbi:Wzz/FepE/Etk N-terminal domain-containing protein [Legionella cardiaca]|uniref:Wzz/FepE/Etk N-terminal domain-containing protein n=1 Tax=Legionella cardiaca TaxID=1071983 RepID=A0ABY8ARI8_9GAMM|nr:Wzz/FepE/Etk N-terminal domain-containing protein [Legionella cardiaca]WED41886.1 Wzz/FepE/Etk N-terminal domain-containing protein [Legionella cardiaca]
MSTQSVVGNEIDLIKLFRALWRGKWFIVILTTIISLSTFLYVQKIQPVYQAKIILMPPTNSDLFGLNDQLFNTNKKLSKELKSHITLPSFHAEEVYKIFLALLAAETTRKEFLNSKQKNNKNHEDDFPISLVVIRNDIDRFSVIVNAHSPEVASSSIRHVIEMTNDKVQAVLTSIIQRELQVLKNSLDKQLELLRIAANNAREDDLAQRTSQLLLARSAYSNLPHVNIDNQKEVKELLVEINKIKQKTDVQYIPRIRNLEKMQSLLNYKPDFTNVVFSRPDGSIEVSETYTRYKSNFFIAFSVACGLIMGFILIILFNFKSLLTTPKLVEVNLPG